MCVLLNREVIRELSMYVDNVTLCCMFQKATPLAETPQGTTASSSDLLVDPALVIKDRLVSTQTYTTRSQNAQ